MNTALRMAPRMAPRWPNPSVWLAGALGLGLALLIVQWPLPGMLAPLALAALVLVVRKPQWLMAAFAVSLAVPIQHSLAGLPINASDGLLVLWALLLPFMALRAEAPHPARKQVPVLVLCIAPFLLAVLVSQAMSINPSASIKQVARVVQWFVLLPVVLMSLAPDARFRRFAAVALMLTPCLFAIDGVYEYFSHGTRLSSLVGISVPIPEGGEDQIRHTFDVSGRAGSTFGGAQGLAIYLVMSMGVAVAHLLRPPEPWMRTLACLCLCVDVAGLGVAQSRGGLMGAAAMMLAMALLLRPGSRRWLVFVLAASTGLALVVLGLLPQWDGTLAGLVPGGRPEAVLDRLIIWGVVRDVVAAHPFFGVGLGNFRDAFFSHEPWLHVPLAYASLHAHNTYFEILADTGWVGLLCYLGFIAGMGTRLVALMAKRGADDAFPVFTLAAVGSLAAYVSFAMVDMLLLQNMHMLLVMMLTLGLSEAHSPVLGVPALEAAP